MYTLSSGDAAAPRPGVTLAWPDTGDAGEVGSPDDSPENPSETSVSTSQHLLACREDRSWLFELSP